MPAMPGRWYTLPAQERDRLIIQLRRAGWTYKHRAAGRNDGERGVKRALDRIHDGGFGEA